MVRGRPGSGVRTGSSTRRPTAAATTAALATAVLLALPSPAAADPLPYRFDPELAADPDRIRTMMADDSAGLPELPLDELTELTLAGPVSLRLFHEAAGLLDRLVRTDRTDYVWPADPGSCAAHAAFAIPEPLLADTSTDCLAAADAVTSALASREACREAAEPERYVLDYPPGVVNDDNTSNVLDLIGVMGSTLGEFPALYDGVLPSDFEPHLRDILRKLRHETLRPLLQEQLRAFHDALARLDLDAGCFLPEARTRLAADVAGLVAEATAQLDRLEELLRDGEREYALEALRLGAISRTRPELPHPSLTQADRELLAFWIGGVYWRLRGGGFVDLGGTQAARRLGLRRPYGALGELAGLADGVEAADGVYCEIFEGWGEWMDMGTTPGQEDKYYDLVRMTRRGFEQIRTAVSGTTLLNPCTIPDYPFILDINGLTGKGYDTTSLYAGGLSMGPCYYFAWDQLLGWTWAATPPPPYRGVIDGPTAVGEVCTGASIALGLVRTLLFGRATGTPPYAGLDAVYLAGPDADGGTACASGGEFSRVTVVPLDGTGGPLPPGLEVAVVDEPPYVIGRGVESFTDPVTGVTQYTLEVGSDRCSPGVPYDVRIRVGPAVLRETVPVRFACPPVALDGVGFTAEPPEVAADGSSAATIRIAVRDACGNPAFGRAVSLAAFGAAPAVLSAATTTTGDEWGGTLDGVALVEVRSAEPGTMGLAATIEDTSFRSAPDLVTFRPAPADDDADGSGHDADGGGSDGDAASHGDAGSVSGGGGCGCALAGGRGGPIGCLLLGLALALRRRRSRSDARRGAVVGRRPYQR